MTIRYTGNGGIHPVYECIGRWEHGNKATCSYVPAKILDNAVSEKILSIPAPRNTVALDGALPCVVQNVLTLFK